MGRGKTENSVQVPLGYIELYEKETGLIDWEKVAEKARECKPKLIICGAVCPVDVHNILIACL